MAEAGANQAVADSAAATAEAEEMRRLKRRVLAKAGILALALAVLAGIAWFTPLRDYLHHIPELKRRILDYGAWAPAVFTLLTAGLVAVGVPRLALCVLAGALFGIWGGLLWSLLGTVAGYFVTFFTVRHWGLRDLIARKHPAWGKLAGLLKHNTIPAVILFRQIPIHGMVMNIALGLSPIRKREFFWGTLIGLIPEAVPAVLVGKFGTSIAAHDLKQSAIILTAAVVLLAAGWMAWGAYTRRAAAKEADLEGASKLS